MEEKNIDKTLIEETVTEETVIEETLTPEGKERVSLRKSDLIKHWAIGLSCEAAYNYERLQALGTATAMIPIVKRLYKTKEEQVAALKKYMIFFNTEPHMIGTVIHGISASMEEAAANGEDVTPEDINSVRTGLMGPMAGIGDTISQGILFPIIAGIGCSLALEGNFLGPILFFLIFTGVLYGVGYKMYMLGYKQGKTSVIRFLKEGTLDRITTAFSIIGLMVVGTMAASRVNIITPLSLGISADGGIVLQDILNSLLPGILPLGITLGISRLLNKKVSSTLIILIIFAVGVIGSLLGILGVPVA